MIGGLPWTAWLLLALAVAPGVALAIVSHRAHRRDQRGAPRPSPTDPPSTDLVER